ncbi:MAG: dihydroorotase [Clostridia bacterium]|nr:dihydroorotase [Clostridia bacterium]
MKLLIKGGQVIDPRNGIDRVCDIYIEDGIITEIDNQISISGEDTEVIDAKGLTVLPGLIDMHCHLREPGYEYKEDIESGSKSAVMGGFTSVACMPNTNPVTDTASVVSYIIERGKSVDYANVYPIGAISKGLEGEQMAEIGEMKFAGVVGVSDDGKPVSNPGLMKRALIYANMFDTIVISHCEDKALAGDGAMNDGDVASIMGIKGIPNSAEEVMVARDILIAEAENMPVHIAHVSTKGSVELVRAAKKRGVKVTCETCPHYFSLTQEAVRGYNTNAKMNPPLRTDEDVEAIKAGIADGTIDAIATDHAPHHIDEKRCEFVKASNGIIGFETALPLAITYLVREGVITMAQLAERMSVAPANILGLNKGSLAVGKAADITIINPAEQIEVTEENIVSKSKNTPYIGYKLYGKVCYTVVGGKVKVRMGELCK